MKCKIYKDSTFLDSFTSCKGLGLWNRNKKTSLFKEVRIMQNVQVEELINNVETLSVEIHAIYLYVGEHKADMERADIEGCWLRMVRLNQLIGSMLACVSTRALFTGLDDFIDFGFKKVAINWEDIREIRRLWT